MDDSRIIALYFNRDETAIEETNRKYGAYCYTVANNILSSHEDAEECVNDTWMRTWNSIPPQRPQVLKLFLLRITRNVSLDRLKAVKAKKRGGGETELAIEELSECIPGAGDVIDEMIEKLNALNRVHLPEAMAGESGAERVAKYSVPMACGLRYNFAAKAVDDEVLAALAELIRQFVHSLPDLERAIFVRRYFFLDSIKAVADRYGMSEGSVMTRLSRTRKKLRTLLEKEMN